MIHLYTGDGKGKTTAAVGLAVRAAGSGMSVIFAQFERVRICRSPRDFGFYGSMSGQDKRELTQIHNGLLDTLLAEAESGTCGMIVLDEITYPVRWGLLDQDKLRRLLQYKHAELVLTGRDAADFLADAADYITEMRCVRHPYEKCVTARKGIEY